MSAKQRDVTFVGIHYSKRKYLNYFKYKTTNATETQLLTLSSDQKNSYILVIKKKQLKSKNIFWPKTYERQMNFHTIIIRTITLTTTISFPFNFFFFLLIQQSHCLN